jgi:hypothetical protein
MMEELDKWIARLESTAAVRLDTPGHTRDVVVRALADADELIRANGATSAVDRIHTALHGRALGDECRADSIRVPRRETCPDALAAPRPQRGAPETAQLPIITTYVRTLRMHGFLRSPEWFSAQPPLLTR